ncbi:MAG: 50S ribosomal protein L24 [Lactobacillales bacterium]|jgi:large subunit ribosomal protein L24|nr:50S ribosomal protein L24 [Lactobacillales bacterium]
MAKIKKGDQVIVISGDDKGKTGEVMKVMPKEAKVLVQGVNVVKRHTKPSQESAGGIVTKEKPIHISNVALIDKKTGKATRVGFKVEKAGHKVRVSKRSGDVI